MFEIYFDLHQFLFKEFLLHVHGSFAVVHLISLHYFYLPEVGAVSCRPAVVSILSLPCLARYRQSCWIGKFVN